MEYPPFAQIIHDKSCLSLATVQDPDGTSQPVLVNRDDAVCQMIR